MMSAAAETEAEVASPVGGGMMDRRYEPLDGRRQQHDSAEGSTGMPEHDNDRKNIVYFTLLTAGIGFVLPYNSFIMAADYWQERFVGKSVALDMTMIYILVAFATVLLNNVFLTLIPYKVRVATGYAVSFTTLLFVGICEVAFHMFNANTAYSVNLVAVSLVAVGCTIQQSSFYGFASMLPKKYPQAVMVGESLAGFLVSSNRVVTKLLIENNRISTMIFFLTSSAYIALSYVLHSATIDSPFVKYHLKACAKIVLRPYDSHLDEMHGEGGGGGGGGVGSSTGGAGGFLTANMDSSPVSSFRGKDSLDSTALAGPMQALSFSNPVYDLSNPTTAIDGADGGFTNIPIKSETTVSATASTTPGVASFKVEHILTPTGCSTARCGSFRGGLESRWRVVHAIYPYMVCIALAYCVTLSLYPGLETEIRSCKLKSWMPVLLMFTFNTSDMIGKILAAIPYAWSRRQLTLMSGLRTLLIPLLLLCCTPRERPVISGETMAFFFTAALGVSNGVAGSLPMMLAPSKVPAALKETAGNMMTLSYNVGLTIGSLLGYMFDAILGPQIDKPCPTFPYAPPAPVPEINTTVGPTSFAAAAATTVSTVYSTLVSTTSSFVNTTIGAAVTSNHTRAAIISKVRPSVTTLANYLSTSAAAILTTTTMASPSTSSSAKVVNQIIVHVLENATIPLNNSTAYETSPLGHSHHQALPNGN